MTTWIITKGAAVIYRTQSWPRFRVVWQEVQSDPTAHWTTEYHAKDRTP